MPDALPLDLLPVALTWWLLNGAETKCGFQDLVSLLTAGVEG